MSENPQTAQGDKLSTRIYYLQPNDDIVSVIDRLLWAQAPRVALVISPDAPILLAELDLLRLQRAAARYDTQVALVTIEPELRRAAAKLGLPAYFSLARALRVRWRQGRRPIERPARRKIHRPPSQTRPAASQLSGFVLLGAVSGVVLSWTLFLLSAGALDWRALLKETLIGAAFGVTMGALLFLLAWMFRRWFPRSFRWIRFVFALLVFAVGLTAPLGAGYLIVPQARLTMTPAQKQVSAIARITVVVPASDEEKLDEIDYEGQHINGWRLAATVSGEASIATSGQTQVPSSRASGAIVFSNLLPQSYTIARGTIVRTTAGAAVRFETSGDVTVPPMGQAAVGVTALEPGPQGNVGVGMINQIEGVANRAARVTNPEATYGGGVSHVKAVTQADRDALKRALLSRLRGLGYERLIELPPEEGGLQEGQLLIADSVRVHARDVDMSYNRFVGERADTLALEMHANVTGVVVDKADALKLARHVLLARVPPGYELIQDSYQIGLMGDNILGDGTLTFFVEAQGLAEAELNISEIRKSVRGKPTQQALTTLQANMQNGVLPVTDAPTLEIWPTWAENRLPWLVWRIQIDAEG